MAWFRQPSQRRLVEDKQALAYLYAFGLLAAAPLVLNLPWWTTASLAVAMAWRYARARFGWPRLHGAILLALGALVIGLVLREFHSLFGRDAGFALLVALSGLKLLEMETERDFRLAGLLFFLITAGGFLHYQTIASAAFALGSVTAGLMLFARLTRARPLRANLKLAFALTAQAIPLMLVMYFAFPRLPGALWGVPLPGDVARTGLDDHLRPGSIGALLQSDETAFRASFTGPMPPPAQRYWRALVLWRSDGRGFERGDAMLQDERPAPSGEPVVYDILLEASGKPYLPALDWPATRPERSRLRAGAVLEHATAIEERHGYRVTSYPRQRAATLMGTERRAALQLPPRLSPRVESFARTLENSGVGARARARALLEHFRNEKFFYTLTPPVLGDDPVDEFLFDTRRGYCEHYAAAFVTLMREAGVPSRVVAGYLGGEVNAAGNYLIVRQSDAHAWAEIWVEGEGWVRADPTAAVAPERVELGIEALRRLAEQGFDARGLSTAALEGLMRLGVFEHAWLRTRLYWDLANLSWYRWVMDYNPERQQRLFEALGLGWKSLGLVTAMIVAGGAMLIGWALWLRIRTPPPDPAQRLYLSLCRQLARTGLVRAPHEGAHDFAARVARARPDIADALHDLTGLYETLRYAARAQDRALLERFRRGLSGLRARV